jgi:hypothetical protein
VRSAISIKETLSSRGQSAFNQRRKQGERQANEKEGNLHHCLAYGCNFTWGYPYEFLLQRSDNLNGMGRTYWSNTPLVQPYHRSPRIMQWKDRQALLAPAVIAICPVPWIAG